MKIVCYFQYGDQLYNILLEVMIINIKINTNTI